VPLTSWDVIGTEFVPILRIIATKDSLFILKAVGIWRKHGDTAQDMTIEPLAPDVRVIAPEAAVALDNAVWCLSAEGVLKVSDLGVEIVSRPVEVDLLKILGFTNTETLAFAIAYHSDRKYILGLPVDSTDANVKHEYTYNHLTSGWTTWTKALQAGHVLTSDDRLYVSHATDRYVLKERKAFTSTRDDYQDETIDCTVTATGTTTDADGDTVTTATVTYTGTIDPDRGFLFAQGDVEGTVLSVISNGASSFTLTLTTEITVAIAVATLTLPIPVSIRWQPETVGSAAAQKFFSSVQLYPESNSARSVRLGFASNIAPVIEFTDFLEITSSLGWGIDPWGTAPWGSPSTGVATPVKSPTPTQHKRCEGLSLLYRHSVAKEKTAITQISFAVRNVSDRTVRTPA
jgi:hypothetical protein